MHCKSYNTVFPSTVSLSADAVPVPGGYVVPEGGILHSPCNHSLPYVVVLWEVNLRVPGAMVSLAASAGIPRSLPQVSSPDTLPSANPASFTIHNITSENNSSFVECYTEGLGRSNATVIVEGNGWITTLNIITLTYVQSLADGSVSGELTWSIKWASPTLAVKLAMPIGTRKFTSQSTPTFGKLLLQVNVIFPPTGTTYPPGAGTASADRVTVLKWNGRLSVNQTVCDINKTATPTAQTCTSCYSNWSTRNACENECTDEEEAHFDCRYKVTWLKVPHKLPRGAFQLTSYDHPKPRIYDSEQILPMRRCVVVS